MWSFGMVRFAVMSRMKNRRWICVVLLGWVLGGAVSSSAVPVDARHSAEFQPVETPDQKRWLPARIRQLEDEYAELQKTISRLPQHAPRALSDYMGYHSVPLGDLSTSNAGVSQIEVQFEFDPKLGAIALAPALVPEMEGSYAFPKRFKIEVLDRGVVWLEEGEGEWFVPPPPYEWKDVVNWMEQDFPDPGPYPVFFDVEGVRLYKLRVTVQSDPVAAPFYALGELYLFRDPEHGDRLGDNMMAWDTVLLSTSNSLSKPPLWSETGLNDGIVGLGMPLSEQVSDVDDFMVSWGEGEVAGPVQIDLDLKAVQPIGRVQLWPAKAPHGMSIPTFGFPGKVSVELSNGSEFAPDDVFFKVEDVRGQQHGSRLLNIMCQGKNARYIRLTLDDFGEYTGNAILGLGEIRVSEFDEVWSVHCDVSATGIPSNDLGQLPRLVDGFCRKRQILREADWIRGLALRRPLDRRLAVVAWELEQARNAWSRLKFKASIWAGGLLCFGLLGAMGLQRLQRRKVLKHLRTRITRDLHDEVGSGLGGITLAARRMEIKGATKHELSDLSLMAREASASLKDVVWVIDQSRIYLPDLLKKLAERAERVLSGTDLHVELPPACPGLVVPLPLKRHLLMFFKEAVHNCARHSGATVVWLTLSVDGETLSIRLKDNGCGFSPEANRDGWGVDSMRKRAEELGGEMDLQTAPGKGTTVRLSVPLDALQNKTDPSYKTSN